MISRPGLAHRVRSALSRSPVVALIGPRQCGKTTLARTFLGAESPGYFDLEDPVAAARLDEPMTALSPLRGLVLIDEIQRRPGLFQVLRVLADRRPRPARFLVLGSASPGIGLRACSRCALVQGASETLAGRIETIAMSGFSLAEVGPEKLDRLWVRGSFPPAFLARSERDSFAWRREFVRTFVERDLPLAGVPVPPATMLRFWTMLAHWHGGIWNAAELARAFGLSEPTVRRYLDVLSGLFMVRQLPPWHENLAKRQVKAPKIYLRDSGLLHQLLGLSTERELLAHPRVGASWEGFALETALQVLEPDEAYFWATHTGAELDLLLFRRGRRVGVEMKRSDAPTITSSMRVAMDDLKLERLLVLYPGSRRYALDRRIEVMPLAAMLEDPGWAWRRRRPRA